MKSLIEFIFEATYIALTYILPIIFTVHTIYEADDFYKHFTKGYNDTESLEFRDSQLNNAEDYLKQLDDVMYLHLKICSLSLAKCMPRVQVCIYWCVYWFTTCFLDRFVYPGTLYYLDYADIKIESVVWKLVKMSITVIILIHTYEHPAQRERPLSERNHDRLWSVPSLLMKIYVRCLEITSSALEWLRVDCTPARISHFIGKGNNVLTLDQHTYFNRGTDPIIKEEKPMQDKTVFVMDTQNSYDIVSTSECNSILSSNSSASSYSSANSNTTGRFRSGHTRDSLSEIC
ncbi:uncharacterized protein Ecym_5143 [Eremothecium cymbalariae DBVPG|uniref:Uncharacterized protein n=1 Tax=Eremothecium cymbalariae (strain CBS 270.75 / DBVPG 7215 / KCTC 17166 / NRRL Y-17582) TaxID=931890 RepID=I6NCX8_ERECY|nr:hypothetical protein Ecym_5143 [Eremothecium cymbalariae DBVPG\